MGRKRKGDVAEPTLVEVPVREVGTAIQVDPVTGLAYEVRKDGSIAYFTQEQAQVVLQREVGS
jgi:hypothetical protein